MDVVEDGDSLLRCTIFEPCQHCWVPGCWPIGYVPLGRGPATVLKQYRAAGNRPAPIALRRDVFLMPSGPLNAAQVAVLQWLADGNTCAEASNSQRLSARALASRRLLTIKGHGAEWVATLTDAGQNYLDTGDYPEGHFPPLGKGTASGASGRRVSASSSPPRAIRPHAEGTRP